VRAHRRANEEAILDATETLLRARPYRDLSIDDVMASTGLTRTAFYRYFPDLESVLLRLVDDIGSELTIATRRWIEADPADGRAALVEAGLGLARASQSHGQVLAAFADAAAVNPDVDDAWRGVIGGFVDDNIARLTDLRNHGISTLEHPEQTARALVWMTERYLLETYGRGGGLPADVVAETLAEIWYRVLFTATPAASAST
jgi:AcrR family transcriptional regulator